MKLILLERRARRKTTLELGGGGGRCEQICKLGSGELKRKEIGVSKDVEFQGMLL